MRYRFGPFLLSPARRLLLDGEREVPLIPRYFDLLLLLVQRRHEAVSRRLIFDRVWSDVVVSDGALSQAIRTLRCALGDDPREPRYIRTVARHGYRFVYDGMIEEPDGPDETTPVSLPAPAPTAREPRALPLGRAYGAALAATVAGLAGGLVGGVALRWAGDWNVPATLPVALGFVGAVAGGLGGTGVGLGLAAGKARAARARPLVLMACGALGGGAVGLVTSTLARWTIEGLFGQAILPIGGVVEGLTIGAATGLAYGVSARPPHGERPRRTRARQGDARDGSRHVRRLRAGLVPRRDARRCDAHRDRSRVPGLAGGHRAARAPARRARPRPAHARGSRRVGRPPLRRQRRARLHEAPLAGQLPNQQQ